ncbi:lytic polysaccharide monooxygenase auxiliary activity family 9 protein [Umezawaea beigongshangensis]|uniref:lytic polysaccharide monooxygenase auxiliary activity family 9 protein n=1 Tax=Umezawaea beigongshangensis TaxID=2780383 RepID=UPI0027DBA7B3|nr:lytic polysaccharide monooxygenase [Umezawaea beigongshangensis]
MRRGIALLSAAFAALLVAFLVNAAPASAHGTMMKPGSRTFLCWKDGLSPQGNIVPQNPACAAAVNAGGTNALYNWFSVLRSDGAGRTRGFIPDGQLCSGGNPTFSGFDIPSTAWPLTHVTAGGSWTFAYNAWAAHPGSFRVYITKDSWSPTRPLAWNDVEDTPFLTVTNPPMKGSVGTVEGQYNWTGTLPSGKSGQHVVYTVWERSDSRETFYSCSDVVFDGGNGQETGVGTGGPTTTPPTTTPPVDAGCAATYRVTSTWNGGFSGEVSVANTGTSAVNGWRVGWTLGGGQTISNVWNGTLSTSGSAVTVANAPYNGTVGGGASTTFGFNANGTSTAAPTLSCAVS